MVIKRDGRKEKFNGAKIKKAIKNCAVANNTKITDYQLRKIVNLIKTDDDVEVETVQDKVVENLNKINKKLAKKYQEYRMQRTKIRDLQTNGKYYDTIMELVRGEKNDTSTENSNKDAAQISTIRDLIAGETCKKLYKDNILSPKIAALDEEGVIHIHDKDYRIMRGITNCGLINFEDIFENGTVINGKLIETPKSLRTASTIATQVITSVSSNQYGGTSMTLSHLAPFVRVSYSKIYKRNYEKSWFKFLDKIKFFRKIREAKIKKDSMKDLAIEVKDSMQTFLYQLNSMTSTNGQTPFITVFCYINENEEYKEENIMLIKEIFKQRIQGMKSPTGHTISPTFPKIIYVLDEDNYTEGTEYFEITKLAAKCVSRRMVPDFISAKVMKKYKEGNVFPSMGCRSFLHPWKDKNGDYKFYGRLNIGVISINLPYIALRNSTFEGFKNDLKEVIDIVCSEHYKVYNSIINTPVDVAPILWKYGAFARVKQGQFIGDIIKDGYCSASVGYMGIAEVVYRFGIEYPTEAGRTFGLKVINFMNKCVEENKEKYNLALSLYGTPAESLTTKFANACKKFKVIPHVNDRYYLTNSYHIPVEYPIDGFSKIDFESAFQKYSTGGCISYVEMPDVRKNIPAVLHVMKHIYDKMMYCEINTTTCSTCYKCGYEGEMTPHSNGTWSCPNCGNSDPNLLHIIFRTCGYMGEFTFGTTIGRFWDIVKRVVHF